MTSVTRQMAREALVSAIRDFLDADGWLTGAIDPVHLRDTPERVVRMYEELFSGASEDPQSALSTIFPGGGEEMVTVYDIPMASVCAHHILPFYGRAHVGYIPRDGQVIGLSKIPRLVDVLSRRPQVQESLTSQIADHLMESKLRPRGAVVCIDAVHTCMACRGIRTPAVTRTTAIRGVFRDEPSALSEFLKAVKRLEI